MKKRSVLLLVLVIAVSAACGNQTQTEESTAGSPAAIVNPVDPATAGNIAGRVTFDGVAPEPATIRMDSDPRCASPSEATDETLLVGESGALQNVFVYVKQGLGDLRFPVPASPAVIDQKGCQYIPHVLGVQVGQALEVINSDATLHNVHAIPLANDELNTGQPIQGMKHTHMFTAPEVMIPFKCDVHGWMRAHVGVLEHPFFSVTGDGGTFEIKGLPPGTYVVEIWHETLGTQTQTITLGPNETKADVDFVFAADVKGS